MSTTNKDNSIIIYNSTAEIEVKPTIVNICIIASGKGNTAKESIDNIIKQRQIIKDSIISKNSYKENSYKQTKININKERKIKYFNDVNKREISEFEYNKLQNIEKTNYVEQICEQYVSTIYINATLLNKDTVIDDFTDIFNLAISLGFSCNYNHTILDHEKENIDMKLYSECINKGLDFIRGAIGNTTIQCYGLKLLKVSNVNNFDSNINAIQSVDKYKCSSHNVEQIIIPELIQDLFNNNIVFNKTLKLKIQIES